MSFDVQTCVDLHNTIIARGIAQLPPNLHPIVIRNWFVAYNVDPTNPGLDFEMTEPLKEFLAGIDIVKRCGQARRLAFTPFLVGISDPSEMKPDLWEIDPDHYGQFIRLYRTNGEDPGGLFMSLNGHGVSFMDTCEVDPHDGEYMSLESALRSYLHYIDAGKFVVDTAERGDYGDGCACEGWRYEGYLPIEVEMALDTWDSLVESIASKMPGSPSTETDEVLIPLSVLDQQPSIPLFARAFLSRAKKPPFKMIAPELLVPDEGFVHRVGAQLAKRYGPATESLQLRCPTANFLLFPWTTTGVPFASMDEEDRWVRNRRLLDDRAGLYLSPVEVMTNNVTMLLPFPIGQRRYVLRSDGETNARAEHDVLYQHGVCNWALPYHGGTTLGAVLSTWYDLVQSGTWPVDANGVAGGDGRWRLADTREHAEKFRADWLCYSNGASNEDVEA